MGLSSTSVLFLGFNYLSLSLTKNLLNLLLTPIKKHCVAHGKVTVATWNYLLYPLIIFIEQILHGSYMSKVWFRLARTLVNLADIGEEFFPDKEKLLMDREYCLSNKKACKELVFRELGISPDTSDREISKAVNRLLLLKHPDRNPGASGTDEAIRAIWVKNRLYDLRNTSSRLTFFPSQKSLKEGTKEYELFDTCKNPYYHL